MHSAESLLEAPSLFLLSGEPALQFELGTLWLRKRFPRQQTHHNTSMVSFLRGAASVPRRSAVALQSAKQVKSRIISSEVECVEEREAVPGSVSMRCVVP